MKKLIYIPKWVLFCVSMFLVLNSCQKENDKSKASLSVNETENRVNLWLEKQLSANEQANNAKIHYLKKNLTTLISILNN